MKRSERPLNFVGGHSIETIAAYYETDAALADFDDDLDNPYVKAALAAEDLESALDRGKIIHSGPHTKFCVLCLSGEHYRV